CAVNDGEEVAADAVRNRFGQAERGVRRDRSVDRAAAAFQNVETDLRGQRHARANHAVSCQHFRAGGEILSSNPIDLGVEWKGESEKEHGRGRGKADKRGHGRRLRRLLSEENRPLTRAPSGTRSPRQQDGGQGWIRTSEGV